MLYILSAGFFVFAVLDVYNLFGFRIKNPVAKIIIYSGALLCGAIGFIIDLFMMF